MEFSLSFGSALSDCLGQGNVGLDLYLPQHAGVCICIHLHIYLRCLHAHAALATAIMQ
jgi:hypothetical protein